MSHASIQQNISFLYTRKTQNISTHDHGNIPYIHLVAPARSQDHFRSSIHVWHDIINVLFVAKSRFSKISKDWQPTSWKEALRPVDCSVFEHLSRRRVCNLSFFESGKIASLWSGEE